MEYVILHEDSGFFLMKNQKLAYTPNLLNSQKFDKDGADLRLEELAVDHCNQLMSVHSKQMDQQAIKNMFKDQFIILPFEQLNEVNYARGVFSSEQICYFCGRVKDYKFVFVENDEGHFKTCCRKCFYQGIDLNTWKINVEFQ